MRTVQQIRDEIRLRFQANIYLTALDYLLPTSVEGALIDVFTVVIYSFELLFYAKISEIQAEANKAEQYVAAWYVAHTLKFQYGDTLVWDETLLKYGYAANNAAAQIVKCVAITPTDIGGVLVKVSTKTNSGLPIMLSATEAAALQGYWDNLKPVGTPVEVRSVEADRIKLYLNVKFDSYLPIPQIQAQVEAAVVKYITTLEFGGIFIASKLIDAIQQVTGIMDVWTTSIEAKPFGGNYGQIGNDYVPYAGYMEIDPATPLSTTINYIPS